LFKNIRGNETFCGCVTSKPSSTYHAYISFFSQLKMHANWARNQEEEEEEEEDDDDWFLRWRECAP